MIAGIFGAGRNGSTLIMRLLDGSPDIWIHPVEVNYLSVFSDLSRFRRVRPLTTFNATVEKPLKLDGRLETETLIRQFSGHVAELDDTYLKNTNRVPEGRGDPLKRIRQRRGYAPDEFLPVFLEEIRRSYDDRGRRRLKCLMFKSIETAYIEDYERVFPEMRFLHIVRDPISNYASLKRTNMVRKRWPFWYHGGDELKTLIEKRWIPHARFAAQACASPSRRHYLVRYEDLCRQPEKTILGACEWLGVRPPKDPALQTVMGGKRMGKLPSNPSKEGVATPERVVGDMAERYGYEDVLTAREKAFILQRTSGLAHRLGYSQEDGGGMRPGRLRLAREWLLPDKWEIKNADSLRGLISALIRRRLYICRSLLSADV